MARIVVPAFSRAARGLFAPHDPGAHIACRIFILVRLYPSIFVNIGGHIGAVDKGVQKCR
jgi:hypothetical protein